MTKKTQEMDRDQMINEWMRSNEAFKSLARQYGKGGKQSGIDDEVLDQPKAAARVESIEEAGVDLNAKQEALLSWLGENEAFKRLAKQYGRNYPRPDAKI